MSIRGYFTLRATVKVAVGEGHPPVWKDGIITGRTLEQNARYDVLFSDGTVERNVAADRIRPRDDSRYF
jgi:hypothetical protein